MSNVLYEIRAVSREGVALLIRSSSMRSWKVGNYRDIFRYTSFRRFWLGFTCSAVGDAMMQVVLVWFIYQSTHSPQAVSWLLLCYTGPLILGGVFAGALLDRFDRRIVMFMGIAFQGIAVTPVLLFSFSGHLTLWPIYLVAAVCGCLTMITLAGGPALVPSLLPQEQLATANALETLSYTLSGVVGPPIAGFLIISFGAPSVIMIDIFSYTIFALALIVIHVEARPYTQTLRRSNAYRLGSSVSFLLKNSFLLSTTLMFIVVNIGEGCLSVWLPVFSDQVLRGGPQVYSLLLSALAIGEVGGSILASSLLLPLLPGVQICLGLALSGVALSMLLLGPTIWWSITGLVLFGLFSTPPSIWTQTLRMQIIPEQMRGRTFAFLRTLSRSSVPMGNLGAGALLLILGIPTTIGLSAILVGVPGVFGYGVKQLRLPAAQLSETKSKMRGN
jgi:MFS family permease